MIRVRIPASRARFRLVPTLSSPRLTQGVAKSASSTDRKPRRDADTMSARDIWMYATEKRSNTHHGEDQTHDSTRSKQWWWKPGVRPLLYASVPCDTPCDLFCLTGNVKHFNIWILKCEACFFTHFLNKNKYLNFWHLTDNWGWLCSVYTHRKCLTLRNPQWCVSLRCGANSNPKYPEKMKKVCYCFQKYIQTHKHIHYSFIHSFNKSVPMDVLISRNCPEFL